jgi:chromosome segregation ATPase
MMQGPHNQVCGVQIAVSWGGGESMENKVMTYCRRLIVIFEVSIALGLLTVATPAQTNAQERAANLRAQLADTEARQAELQIQLQQLDEDLKPENIEHTLAGIGSVHPEELREARRRQLEIKKRSVQSQIDTLAANRSRLETAIVTADAESYRQSVGPGPNISTGTTLRLLNKRLTGTQRKNTN